METETQLVLDKILENESKLINRLEFAIDYNNVITLIEIGLN